MKSRQADLVLALACMLFGAFALFWWIPAQVETGVVEQMRRQVVIGDAMAPTVWATAIGVLGLLLAVQRWFGAGGQADEAGRPAVLTLANVRYLVQLVLLMACVLCAMRWAGPLIVDGLHAMGLSPDGYRALRAERPWKYIGYLLGGFTLTFATMSFVNRRFSWRTASLCLFVALAIALLYDLPFRNLLLPPNGDL